MLMLRNAEASLATPHSNITMWVAITSVFFVGFLVGTYWAARWKWPNASISKTLMVSIGAALAPAMLAAMVLSGTLLTVLGADVRLWFLVANVATFVVLLGVWWRVRWHSRRL
jgi:hypothetical protein